MKGYTTAQIRDYLDDAIKEILDERQERGEYRKGEQIAVREEMALTVEAAERAFGGDLILTWVPSGDGLRVRVTTR